MAEVGGEFFCGGTREGPGNRAPRFPVNLDRHLRSHPAGRLSLPAGCAYRYRGRDHGLRTAFGEVQETVATVREFLDETTILGGSGEAGGGRP